MKDLIKEIDEFLDKQESEDNDFYDKEEEREFIRRLLKDKNVKKPL